MRYQWKKQENGLYSCQNLAIFAATEKGGKKYDADWMLEQVEDARAEEANDVFQPFHIGHSTDGKFSQEQACGRYRNHRLASVRVGKEKKPGILVDGFDIPENVKDQLESGQLLGRSVEVRGGKIRSTALLGATPPHNRLAQSSEPVAFDEHENGLTVTFAEVEDFMMPPPAAPAAPAAPAPAPAPQGMNLEGLKMLCQQMMQMLGGAAPAPAAHPPAPAPAPESKPPSSRFDETFSAEIKAREDRIAELEAALAAAQTQGAEEQEESKLEAFLESLKAGGFVFDETLVRQGVNEFGLERYRDNVAVHFRRAPTASSTTPAVAKAPTPPKPAPSENFREDESFKKIREGCDTQFSEAQLVAGETAAKEWDEAFAQGIELTSFGRTFYVEQQMRRAGGKSKE